VEWQSVDRLLRAVAGFDPDPEVVVRVREVAKVLEGLGHTIDDGAMCEWPALWSGFIAMWVGATLRFGMMAQEKGLGEEDLERLLNPMTWRHFLKAKQFTVAEVFQMMNDNNTVTRQFGMLMNRYDVLLAPTCAVRVPKANGPYSLLAEEELDVWINRLVDAARYTIPANETGLPAISIPACLDSDGLRSACSSTAISLAKICCSALPCSWNKSDPSGSALGGGTRGRLIVRSQLPNAHITDDPTGRGVVRQMHHDEQSDQSGCLTTAIVRLPTSPAVRYWNMARQRYYRP
jgi:hypothetical protein